MILSLGSDTCTEGLSRNSKWSKTYIQGYLDVPCYREVVLNDEGYEVHLVVGVDFEIVCGEGTLTLYCSG